MAGQIDVGNRHRGHYLRCLSFYGLTSTSCGISHPYKGAFDTPFIDTSLALLDRLWFVCIVGGLMKMDLTIQVLEILVTIAIIGITGAMGVAVAKWMCRRTQSLRDLSVLVFLCAVLAALYTIQPRSMVACVVMPFLCGFVWVMGIALIGRAYKRLGH